MQQSGLLGRDVVGGGGRFTGVGIQPGSTGEAEVDERDTAERPARVHDDVGRLDVTVQDPLRMGCDQPTYHADPDVDGLARRQRTGADVVGQRDAFDVGAHAVDLVAAPTDLQRRGEHRGVDTVEHADLVLQAQPRALGEPVGRGRLDDHPRA